MAALTVAAAVAASGAFVALTPSTAGAAGTNPLGPTIAQLEKTLATTEADLQPTLTTLYLEVFGAFGLLSTAECLVGSLSGPTFGPCVDGG